MRARLLTALTVACLAVPVPAALADHSSVMKSCEAVGGGDNHCDAVQPQHKCDTAGAADHKCEKDGTQ